MAGNAEPRHYAGLALLKLADNFENHLRIAEEGGIQALLRLGRTRTTDEQLQYKAALTVGQLASNAVKLLPQQGSLIGSDPNSSSNSNIGYGAQMMGKIRAQAASQRGRKMTNEYMEKSVSSGGGSVSDGSRGGGGGGSRKKEG